MSEKGEVENDDCFFVLGVQKYIFLIRNNVMIPNILI